MPDAWGRIVRTGRSALLLVGALGVALRLGAVLQSPGGLTGSYGYDASVYFASADALLHGRLPYQDFLLLHPPAVLLALSPIAALGQVIGDHNAFMAGNALFVLLAGVNAALVVTVSRRIGLPDRAALLGGVFYAVWFGALQAEVSARLEPLGSFFFLAGCALVLRLAPTRRHFLLGGAAFACCVSTKAWWSLPVLLVLAHLLWRHRRTALPALAGLFAAVAVVDLPFFLAAPSAMWRMLVSDQLGRPHTGLQRRERVLDVLGLRAAVPDVHGVPLKALALLLLIGLGLLAWLALRSSAGRLAVALTLVQGAVLLLAPTYFVFYSGYVAAALALLIAVAAGESTRTAGVAVVVAAVLTGVALGIQRPVFSSPVEGTEAASRAVQDVPCVLSDTPMALIQLDVLSEGLSRGCPNWIDVSGHTYDDAKAPEGSKRGRVNNPVWQAKLTDYLTSGDAFVLFRSETGASADTRRTLSSYPVLIRSGDFTIRSVSPAR